MPPAIEHNNVNVSNHLIRYTRNQQVCTGVGRLIVVFHFDIPRTFVTWDTIELFENGQKVGTYNVSTIKKDVTTGEIELECQDDSKRLMDYFISDSYIIDYFSYSRYWIEKFLDEAGISYQFTISSGDQGTPLSNNTSLGLDYAYNIITGLLQQNGWYLYFNQNNTAIIGDLSPSDISYDHYIVDEDIININYTRNDSKLRNRAVVWGSGNPSTGEWIFADISVHTPWNYDTLDKRAIVLANSNIRSITDAELLAAGMISEFARIDKITVLDLADHYSNIKIGDICYVRSTFHSGRALVTTLSSEGNTNGFTTNVILNERCPRLFAWFSYGPSDDITVYAGTWGSGVYRKPYGAFTWYPYNTGLDLEDYNIKDLFVKARNLSLVSETGYLYQADIVSNFWYKYLHTDLIDSDSIIYPASGIKAMACSMDLNNNTVVGYTYSGELLESGESRSWVLALNPYGVLQYQQQIEIDNQKNITILDLESTGEYNIISVSGVTSELMFWYSNNLNQGSKKVQYIDTRFWDDNNPVAEEDCYVIGPRFGTTPLSIFERSFTCDTLPYIDEDRFFWGANLGSTSGAVFKFDVDDYSDPGQGWNFTMETAYPRAPTGSLAETFIKKIGNKIHLIVIMHPGGSSDPDLAFFHDEYTLGDSVTVRKYSNTFERPFGGTSIEHQVYSSEDTIGLSILWRYFGAFSSKLFVYDVLSSSGNLITFKEVLTPVQLNSYIIFPLLTESGFQIVYFHTIKNYEFPVFPFGAFLGINVNYNFIHLNRFGGVSSGIPTPIFELADGPYTDAEFKIHNINNINGEGRPVTSPEGSFSWVMGELDFIKEPSPSVYYRTRIQQHIQLPTGVVNTTGIWTGLTTDKYWDNRGIAYQENYDPLDIIGVFCGGVSRRNGSSYFVTIAANKDLEPNVYLNFISANGVRHSRCNLTTNFGLDFDKVWGSNQYISYNAFKLADDIDGTIYIPLDPDAFETQGPQEVVGFQPLNGVPVKTITGWRSFGPSPSVPTFAGGMLGGITSSISLFPGVRHSIMTWDAGYDNLPTSPYNILKHVPESASIEDVIGSFENIYNTPKPCKVEISKGSPTVLYSLTVSGEMGYEESFIALSTTNLANDFYQPPLGLTAFDARVFDVFDPATFILESGALPTGLLDRYVGVAVGSGIMIIPYNDFTLGWQNLISVSGVGIASGIYPSGVGITTLETTNYTISPYVFFSVSGFGQFYQRNPFESFWREYSTGLPPATITILRVDDEA